MTGLEFIIRSNIHDKTVDVPVTFDGSGSSDPDGTIVSYGWDFGDGNTGNGPTPTHTYAADGTFNATLTVTDNAGVIDSAGTTATIRMVDAEDVEVEVKVEEAERGKVEVEIRFDEMVEIETLLCGSEGEPLVPPMSTEVEFEHSETEVDAGLAISDDQCDDTTRIVCQGTLADGRSFMGTSNEFKVKCDDDDDDDNDDDNKKERSRKDD
jgi:PKD repeat protein